MVLDGGFGVHDAALVGEGHVGACEDVVGDGLAEDFDAEDIGDTVSLRQYQLESVSGGKKEANISSVSRSRSGWTRAT